MSAARWFLCSCCGNGFETGKKQNPQRDAGFGVCVSCRPLVANHNVRDRVSGSADTYKAELARLERFA